MYVYVPAHGPGAWTCRKARHMRHTSTPHVGPLPGPARTNTPGYSFMKKESNLWHMKPGLLLQGRKEGLWPVVQVQLSFDWISIFLLLRSLKFSFELCMIKEKSGFTFKSSFNSFKSATVLMSLSLLSRLVNQSFSILVY